MILGIMYTYMYMNTIIISYTCLTIHIYIYTVEAQAVPAGTLVRRCSPAYCLHCLMSWTASVEVEEEEGVMTAQVSVCVV